MKNTFKKTPLILYLCLFGLIFSCSPEQDILKSPQKNSRITQKPFKELLLLNSFNNAYEKVKTEKQKNLASRSALEEEFNFTISDKEPVKILEMDNKSYYNILIERAVVDSTYFENLFLIIDNSVAVEDVSAYIIKYTPSTISHNTIHHSFNFQGDIKVNPLVQKTTFDCFTVCYTICHDTGTGESGTFYNGDHLLNSDCSGNNTTIECNVFCVTGDDGNNGEDASTGQSDTGFGTNSGGGGSSSAGNASSPPNDCGVCNPQLPVVPVKDLPEEDLAPRRKPCEELKKLTENLNIKNTYTEAPNGLNHKVNSYKEFGFAFARTDIGDTTTPVPNSSIEPNILDMSNFVGGDFFGASHTHANIEYGVFPMFPLPDLLYLFKVAVKFESNGEPKDYSIFVLTLTVPAGTYAIKIKDVTKFFAFINSPNFEEQKEKLENKFIDIGLTNQNQLTKELLNVLEKNDVGVGLYKAKPDFSDWSELKLKPFVSSTSTNDNSINEIPCNPNN